LNIIHIITGLATGGAEKTLFNLLRGGLKNSFDNHVISLGNEDTVGLQIKETGISVTALEMRAGRPSISGMIKLRRAIKKRKPDLIQGWMYHGNLAAFIARKFAPSRPPLVWNIRQSLYDLSQEKWTTRQAIRLNRLLSSSPDTILYNSYVSRKQHESFGFSSKCSEVIPNGIDIQQFSFSMQARTRVRAELGIPEDALVVGHVARFHPMKDHSTFLHATMDLVSRFPKTHFILIGSDVSPENDIFKQLIPAQVRSRFHLLEERNDVPVLMSSMDIFCQSSWSEAFPNVLGEAMATSVPCVATSVGDSERIIGDTGILVPVQNSKALSEGIEKLINMPQEDFRALGERARTRIEANYNLNCVTNQYIELYENLMSEKGER